MQYLRTIRKRALDFVPKANLYGGIPAMTTYNDLPQPQPDWRKHYDADQRLQNAHLLLGVAMLAGTIVVGKMTGMFEFHDDIPECMPEENCYQDYKK